MDDEEWRNPHCVATVLKMYLNELPTCLFTEEKYFSFVKTFRRKSFLLEVLLCEMKCLFYTARHETRRDGTQSWAGRNTAGRNTARHETATAWLISVS